MSNVSYTAEIGGPSWAKGPCATFPTIRQCRDYAESYGTTADYCYIYNARGRLVAAHHRERYADGTSWYRGAT